MDGLGSSNAEQRVNESDSLAKIKDHEFAVPLPRAPQPAASGRMLRKKKCAEKRTFSSLREPSKSPRSNALNDLLFEALCDDGSWHDVVLLYMDNQGRCLVTRDPNVFQVPDEGFLSYFGKLIERIQPRSSKGISPSLRVQDLSWMERLDCNVMVREKCQWVQAPCCLRRRSTRLDKEHALSVGDNVLAVLYLDDHTEHYFDADVMQIRKHEGTSVQIQFVHGPKVGTVQWASSSDLFRVQDLGLTNEDVRLSLHNGYRVLSAQHSPMKPREEVEGANHEPVQDDCFRSNGSSQSSLISEEAASGYACTLLNWATASEEEIHDFKEFLTSRYPKLSPTFRILSHHKVIIDGSGDLKYTVGFDAQTLPMLWPLSENKWTQCVQLLQKHSALGREAVSEVVKGSISYSRWHAPLKLVDVSAMSSARSPLFVDDHSRGEKQRELAGNDERNSEKVDARASNHVDTIDIDHLSNGATPLQEDGGKRAERAMTFEGREGSWWPPTLNHIFFSSWRASARTFRAVARPVDQLSPSLGSAQQLNGMAGSIQGGGNGVGAATSNAETQRQTNEGSYSKAYHDVIRENGERSLPPTSQRWMKMEKKLAGKPVTFSGRDGEATRGFLHLSRSKDGSLSLQVECNNVCQSIEDWSKRQTSQLDGIVIESMNMALSDALAAFKCEYRDGKLLPIKTKEDGDEHHRGSAKAASKSASRKRLFPEVPEAEELARNSLPSSSSKKRESSKSVSRASIRPTEPGRSEGYSSAKKLDRSRAADEDITVTFFPEEDEMEEGDPKCSTPTAMPGKHGTASSKKRKRSEQEAGLAKGSSIKVELEDEMKLNASRDVGEDESWNRGQTSSPAAASADHAHYGQHLSQQGAIDVNFILERCRIFEDDQKGCKGRDSTERDIILLTQFLVYGLKKTFFSRNLSRAVLEKMADDVIQATRQNKPDLLRKLLYKIERNIKWGAMTPGYDRTQLFSLPMDCMESAKDFVTKLIASIQMGAWMPSYLLRIGWEGLTRSSSTVHG